MAGHTGAWMDRVLIVVGCGFLVSWSGGCATQKESFTARTSVEQLLITSAMDKSLNNIDFSPLADKQVFLETKYLDCVDKNYLLLSLRHRMLLIGAKLLDKADKADVIVEVASGCVGTDNQDLFVGIPEIPLPPPSPIAIPRLAFVTRTKMNGTAKILVVAYDARTRQPLATSGLTLARSDQKNWNVMGMGNVQTGSVPAEIAAATREKDLGSTTTVNLAVVTKNVAAGEGIANPPPLLFPTLSVAGGRPQPDQGVIQINHSVPQQQNDAAMRSYYDKVNP
jgi:hypothetical protein